jgi:hypothetical protein
MHPISLHHIVAPEVTAVDLVRIAGKLGCRHVCLWTQRPRSVRNFPVVEAADVANVHEVMIENGVTAYAVTSFPIYPEVNISSYELSLARGALLGASYASVQIADLDEGRAIDGFARFAERARFP